ncbi:MAG: hypothetical protein Q4Q04_05235 [Methanocorpusculum sp.]|nr:hypothetical protein [Methanocorpusculum sp.]
MVSKLERTHSAVLQCEGRAATAKEISTAAGLPVKSTAYYLQILADMGRVERIDVFNRRFYYKWQVKT